MIKSEIVNQPLIAVVILHWSDIELTCACIESLMIQTYPSVKIILVDNGSQDRADKTLESKFDSIQVIRNEENLGFSGGNNVGIYYALEIGALYVALVNNDAIVAPTYIEEMLNMFQQQPEAGLVAPVITYHDEPKRIWYGGGKFNTWFFFTRHAYMNQNFQAEQLPMITETDYISGCALMIRSDVLREIGLFWDTLFLYFEDLDLSYRARLAGYKCYLLWKPLVLHHISASSGQRGSNKLSPFMAFYFARNPMMLVCVRMKGLKRISGIFGQFTIRFGRYAYQAISTGSFDALRQYIVGMVVGLTHISHPNDVVEDTLALSLARKYLIDSETEKH